LKGYVVVILLLVVAVVAYTFLLPQSNVPKIVISKNFGTITPSLGSPFLGSSNATLTIIEFGNYQCSECQEWFQETRPIIMANYIERGEINMIFIDSELSSKNSLLASTASYCANEQKKYWDYHNMLFLNPVENEIDFDLLKEFATELGLDMDSFEECLESGKYEKKIKYSTYEAKKNGIKRLPTFIIIDSAGNYEKISGSQPYSVFEEKINKIKGT